MTALSISAPFPTFNDTDGEPLENGYIYIGTANQNPVTSPIAVYWDAALTIPAAQPIRTSGGYPVYNGTPANIYANSDYSIRVTNKNGTLVYSAAAYTSRAGAEFVGYLPSGTGAVATTVQSKLRESVSVTDFMTPEEIADAKTNTPTMSVHAAVQKAVDYCLTFDPPAILTVPVLCRFDASVNIDRGVDAANAATYFIIRGDGIGGGFYAYNGVTMFSTTLTTGNPNSLAASQKIHFSDIVFKSEFPSNPTYVLDDAKFLRMKFTNCSFHRIKLLNATRYLQTYYFNNCMAYGWLSTFLNGTNGAYDIKIDNFVAESGVAFYSVVCNDVYSADPNAQISITNSLFQSISGAPIQADRAQGFVVENCYFEGNGSNGAPDLKFDTARNISNLTPNGAIKVSGCYFSQLLANFNDPLYSSIRWGRVNNGFATANYLVNLGTGAELKLHRLMAESRVVLAGEPGIGGQLYASESMYSGGGYVMPGTGGERLKILRGEISAVGAIVRGTGFTLTKTGTGQYQIDAQTAFSAPPSIVASPIDSNGINVSAIVGVLNSVTMSVVIRNVAHAFIDSGFQFTVIGPA